jgi:hypothetical protein
MTVLCNCYTEIYKDNLGNISPQIQKVQAQESKHEKAQKRRRKS